MLEDIQKQDFHARTERQNLTSREIQDRSIILGGLIPPNQLCYILTNISNDENMRTALLPSTDNGDSDMEAANVETSNSIS